MIAKIFFVFLLVITQSFSLEFESETPDLLLEQQEQSEPKKRELSVSKEFVQEDAIHKPDPLLETLRKEKKDEPTLLEKILLQQKSKKVEHPKQVFKKPLIESNEISTPDPLLDEI